MTTYYATFLRPGTLWDPDKTVREQPYWDDHARFMDSLFETGVVILGGPFADRTGSMVISGVEIELPAPPFQGFPQFGP